MRIALLGLYRSFDYHHIGGTDFLARRLGCELVRRGEEVDFVHFGVPQEKEEDTPEGMRLRYCRTFEDGLQALAGHYDNVLTIYVPPRQRLAFARFRQREARRTRFHVLYTGWPESRLKRELLFLESRLAPYNGYLFCASPRQQRHVSKWSNRTMLLLPPVPESYFLRPEEKSRHDRLRVVYMGRIDPGKGTPAAIALFRHLGNRTEFETRIYGYPWSHKPETMQLHEQLLAQDVIPYEPTEFEGYSPAVDARVHSTLRETDVLYLPYDKLSSTIDTPLLLLEGMAHLCAVITRPLGSMPEIYGTDEWMVLDISNLEASSELLMQLANRLSHERKRLFTRCRELQFQTTSAANHLLNAFQALCR